MTDQVIAALITGGAGVLAALIGLVRWRIRTQEQGGWIVGAATTPPIFESARFFSTCTTLEDKKKAIQQIEVGLSHGTVRLTNMQMEQCAGSDYELDRIGLYLFEEYTAQPNPVSRLLHVQHEFDLISAATTARSPLPLFYALRSLLKMLNQHDALRPLVREQIELLNAIKHRLSHRLHDSHSVDIPRVIDKLIALL